MSPVTNMTREQTQNKAGRALKDMSTAERTAIIRHLNEALRRHGEGGWTMVTAGIASLPEATRERVLAAVKSFETFDEANDPFGEHDFGVVKVDGVRCLFKIDYYDETLDRGSEDSADPEVTRRVLTIMLGDEF